MQNVLPLAGTWDPGQHFSSYSFYIWCKYWSLLRGKSGPPTEVGRGGTVRLSPRTPYAYAQCPVATYDWIIGSHGDCSSVCGPGTHSRQVICQKRVDSITSNTTDEECLSHRLRKIVSVRVASVLVIVL